MDGLGQIIRSGNNYGQLAAAAGPGTAARVKDEFLTIFYKELLKQVFKTPDLSIGDDEEKTDRTFSAFSQDLMVDQLAEQLAKNAAISQGWAIPKGESAAGNE